MPSDVVGRRDGDERVHVVEGRGVGQARAEDDGRTQRTSFQPMWGSFEPAGVERDDLAGQQPEAVGAAELGAVLEQQLHAQARAEHRHAGGGALAHEVVQAGLGAARASPRRTRRRPGSTSPSVRPQRLVVAREHDRGADALERLLARSGGCPSRSRRWPIVGIRRCSVPLVDGTPVSVGSIATATRSARAKALNAASIMWWALVPVSTVDVQRQPRAAGDRPEELLGQLVVEVAGAAGREVGLEGAGTGGPEMSSAHARARLVHRHDGVAVAA